jgi:small-conductance mechanosensitive channel
LSRRLIALVVILVSLISLPAGAAPEASPSAAPSAAESGPIPLAAVAGEAEATLAGVRAIDATLEADVSIPRIESALPTLSAEIDQGIARNRQVLQGNPSLDAIRGLRNRWIGLQDRIPAWKTSLSSTAEKLDGDVARLTAMRARWESTLKETEHTEMPPEVIARVEAVRAAIEQTLDRVQAARARVLTLQTRIAEQEGRIDEALGAVAQNRDEAMTRLFAQDSPPLWSVRLEAGAHPLVEDSAEALDNQLYALQEYCVQNAGLVMMHLLVTMMLVALLYRVRDTVAPWLKDDVSVRRAARVFDAPVATGLVLSLLVGTPLYPSPPDLFSTILDSAALIPTIYLLRRLLEPGLYVILYALVTAFAVDLVRDLVVTVPLVYRGLLLIETLGAILFLLYLIRRPPAGLGDEGERRGTALARHLRLGMRGAVAVFAVALLSNVLGYLNLSRLLVDAVFQSGYVGLILYGTVRILDGLMMFFFRIRPLNRLTVVRQHRAEIRSRANAVLAWLAFALWAVFTLEALSIGVSLISWLRVILGTPVALGTIRISLANVIFCAVTIWLAFASSAAIQILLDEDVYPRLTLARGVPYLISTLAHYVVLVGGFLIGLAALGIDMTKFTILAGAFGVGLGFGLQNIFNNFVSGLILLFERPVNVGDRVELKAQTGNLERVGLRASVVRIGDGSDMIVPNSVLISDTVINRTFASSGKLIEIDVSAPPTVDPEAVIARLGAVAREGDVLETPAPEVVVASFDSGAINFSVRVWVDDSRWIQARSDLNKRLIATLRKEGLGMPAQASP